MTAAHTPGPWGIRSTGAVGSDGGSDKGYMICLTHPCTEDGHETEESRANALLIAVAPDLKNELELAADTLTGLLDFFDEGTHEWRVIEQRIRNARASIRATKGGAQ